MNCPPASEGIREMQSEIVVAKSLRRLLATLEDGAPIEWPEKYSDTFNGFEYLLPQLLSQHYAYWKHESFDGFFPATSQKIGPYSAEIVGVCILISDQTVTPINIRIGILPPADEIAWMDCKVGARGSGAGAMTRTPWPIWRENPLCTLTHPVDSIDWVYSITLGHEAQTETPPMSSPA
jgi:hypothetical protein